jgi:hypothetical protein
MNLPSIIMVIPLRTYKVQLWIIQITTFSPRRHSIMSNCTCVEKIVWESFAKQNVPWSKRFQLIGEIKLLREKFLSRKKICLDRQLLLRRSKIKNPNLQIRFYCDLSRTPIVLLARWRTFEKTDTQHVDQMTRRILKFTQMLIRLKIPDSISAGVKCLPLFALKCFLL